jgi:uncharacterized membrane protein YbhN (UPF0104 family)
MNPSTKKPTGSEKSSSAWKLQRKPLKQAVKITGSIAAIFLLLSQVDISVSLKQISTVAPVYFLLAIILFNASQWLSALRLNTFFRDIGVRLTEVFNLRLYYIGMFYNLLVPGGVGGDGLKGYLIYKNHNTAVKPLALAMIADRFTGLIGIFIWATVLIISQNIAFQSLDWLAISGTIISMCSFYLVFKNFRSLLLQKLILALLVQGAQMTVIFVLLLGMGVENHYLGYLLVFLASSVATIIPITIGGLGLRELVFLYGAKYLGLNPDVSVSASLLFFLITLISSLPGLYFHNTIKNDHWQPSTS